MSLLQTIKSDSLAARKSRDTATATALTTLIGELETAAKNSGHEPSDAEVIAAIKKTIKNLDESIRVASAHGNHTTAERLNDELKLFEKYLPKQLSGDELEDIIDLAIASGAKSVGDVMKLLKTSHAGLYDGALASTILKTKFAK